jgi:hypothetical protein
VLCFAETAVRAARLAARAADPGRHPAHRDASLTHSASDPMFLDLPGPRWRFGSDVPGDTEWQRLYPLIDAWCDAELQPGHKR